MARLAPSQGGQGAPDLPNFDAGSPPSSLPLSQTTLPSAQDTQITAAAFGAGADAQRASTFEGLASKISGMADKAAGIEGEAQGKIAGLDPNYRPEGDITIRGHAFETAATQTYVNSLSAQTKNDVNQAWQDYNNLPVSERTPDKLNAALAKIESDYHGSEIVDGAPTKFRPFPTIRGQWQDQFASLKLAYANKATDLHDEDVKNAAQASTLQLIDTTRATASRMASLGTPEGAAAAGKQLSAADAQIDQAVEDGNLTPQQAYKQKTALRQDAAQTFALAKFTALPAGEQRTNFVKAFEEDWKKSGAATKGLNEETYDQLHASMLAQIRSDASQGKQVQHTALTDINQGIKTLEKGDGLASDVLAGYTQKYAGSADPAIAQRYEQLQKLTTMFAGFKGKRPEAIEADIANTRAKLQSGQGGANAQQEELLRVADAYIAKQRSDLARDPIGRAAKDGFVSGVMPIVATDPATLAHSLVARMPAAEHAAEAYGQPVKYLLPGERELFKSIAARGGPDMVNMAGAITDAMGPKAPILLKEIGGDAPEFAQLGKLKILGGDPEFMRDVAEAQRLRGTKDAGKLPQPSAQASGPVFNSVYGSAFQAMPDFNAGARNTALQGFSAQALRRGLDPALGGAASDALKKSAQLAAGATFDGNQQFGGVADYKPAGWWQTSAKLPIPACRKRSAL
jgi:hypothetical protein